MAVVWSRLPSDDGRQETRKRNADRRALTELTEMPAARDGEQLAI